MIKMTAKASIASVKATNIINIFITSFPCKHFVALEFWYKKKKTSKNGKFMMKKSFALDLTHSSWVIKFHQQCVASKCDKCL